MDVVLPEIDIALIKDSKLSVKVFQLINIVEEVLKKMDSLIKENILLKQEIAKLKKQSSPPTFSSKDYSATKRMKAAPFKWKKSKKKGALAVDQVVKIPKATICQCGSTQFTAIRTHERVVQDIIIKRNNILYQWTDYKCVGCGKIHKGTLPEEIKGQEFGGSLRSWTSVLKYNYRFTLPLLHRLYTGVGIKISTGELSHIILKNSNALQPVYTYLKVWGIKLSRYLQSDATGMKRKADRKKSTIVRQHLHFLGHKFLSIFKITRRYNTDQFIRYWERQV
jgi:regulator of replication initiation timing